MSLPRIEIPDITPGEKQAVREGRSCVGRANTLPMSWSEEVERIQIVARLRGHSQREIVEALQEIRTHDWAGLQAASAVLLEWVQK